MTNGARLRIMSLFVTFVFEEQGLCMRIRILSLVDVNMTAARRHQSSLVSTDLERPDSLLRRCSSRPDSLHPPRDHFNVYKPLQCGHLHDFLEIQDHH